jgi:L-2,4-diaminobutyric acid acetyltransferase
VGVDVSARGHGVARRLLGHLLDRPTCAQVSYLEATVTPSNTASWALFRRIAADRDAAFHHHPGFLAADFGGEHHEPEQLVRIGPFNKQHKGV